MNDRKIPTENYKGVRDFYPEDMAVQKYLFEVWRNVAESFGYVEYSASLLEPTELYASKTSEEIVNEQTYSFKDRGKREVTLRPEMTPTLARMVAARRRDLAFPLRWFSIPNIFRYERPQRGRLREHWQLNCDILGVANNEAEVEVISLAYRLMKTFGARDEDFEIRINNRKTLAALLIKYGLDDIQAKKLRLLLDKKDKVENFEETAQEIVGEPFVFPYDPDAESAALIETLAARGIKNVRFDSAVVRGFDYYTGIVFEVFDTAPENTRSLFGGGRYDNLLELFGAEKVPAVGFGMGDVTTRDFLETHNLLGGYRQTTDLSVCTVSDMANSFAQELAQRLRESGIRVALDTTNRKVGDKIKSADKQRIPYVLCIGEEEIQRGAFKLKNLASSEEVVLNESALVEHINKKK